ncbi:MAG: response regulator transcription factor [Chloroflexi bacterium]|nr:response regulator transcription factor [Chloroflexota bacterium]
MSNNSPGAKSNQAKTNKISVIMVSQQSLFRQGIQRLLSAVEDIEVSAVPEVNDEVLSAIDTLPPDVAIIDIDAPSDNGLKLARRLKQRLPNIGVVVLTSNPDDAQLFQTLKAQAVAYLGKEITADELVDVVKRVANGEHPINESLATRPKLAEQVLQQFQELSWRSEAEAVIAPLTPRETEILNYMARGFLNKQIAVQLSISEQTIKNHVTSILRKLNANVRTEAVVVALKQGLISLS